MPRKQHKQNQYGLSYPGMIMLAIQNSDAVIPNSFCQKACTVKDIYTFLKAHVKPIQSMTPTQWSTTERVIRHSLSQTNYFFRFHVDEEGKAVLVPSQAKGADKGSLWTICNPKGETRARTQDRIKKVFKGNRQDQFVHHLVNRDDNVLEKMIKGDYGWNGSSGHTLGASDAWQKVDKWHKEHGEQCLRSVFTLDPPKVEPIPSQKRRSAEAAKEGESSSDSETAPSEPAEIPSPSTSSQEHESLGVQQNYSLDVPPPPQYNNHVYSAQQAPPPHAAAQDQFCYQDSNYPKPQWMTNGANDQPMLFPNFDPRNFPQQLQNFPVHSLYSQGQSSSLAPSTQYSLGSMTSEPVDPQQQYQGFQYQSLPVQPQYSQGHSSQAPPTQYYSGAMTSGPGEQSEQVQELLGGWQQQGEQEPLAEPFGTQDWVTMDGSAPEHSIETFYAINDLFTL